MKHWAVLLLFTILLTSCSSTETLQILSGGGKQFFILNEVKLIEHNQDTDESVIFGAVSDLHGNGEEAKKIASTFKENQVEYVLILGDMVNSEDLVGDQTDDVLEMTTVLLPFLNLGVPVFVMPGNHESSDPYNQAMLQLQAQYDNIFDMVNYRLLDLDDVSFVAIPGYHDGKFSSRTGYVYGENDLSFIPSTSAAMTHSVVLLTHGPPLTEKENGIDFVSGAGNVGDVQINTILEQSEISYSLFGHVHEGGPALHEGDTEFELTSAWYNLGAGEEGNAAVILMKSGRMTINPLGP